LDSKVRALVTDRDRPLVDPDHPETWPPRLTELMQRVDDVVSAAEYAGDLGVPDEADAEFRGALAGAQLRAFHATRLLSHEVDGIRLGGLQVFSRELFDDRIDQAYGAEHLTTPQWQRLRNAHMYAVGEEHARGRREGQVCLTLRSVAFDHGANSLLSNWGGEGLYFSTGATGLEALLGQLGQPSIVVVAVDVRPTWQQQPIFPTIGRTLLGAWRGLRDGADLFHPAPIPGSDVLDIWQPGRPEYDAIPRLPRA
jgi:hypothetical protein